MISNRCIYALKAVVELAKREGSGPVTIAEIARQQGIPARFLEAILRQLKQNGVTHSVRGKDGGYNLARPARDISLGEVIRIFEGPMIATSGKEVKTGCSEVLEPVWEQARDALAHVFDSFSFEKLCDDEQKRQASQVLNYSI
jgi:Rrf2 family cysteine metabolism transcriptional repressor